MDKTATCVGYRPVDHGLHRVGDAAGVYRVVRLDRRAARHICQDRRWLRRLHVVAVHHLPRGDAAIHVLCGYHPSANHAHTAGGRERRGRNRQGLRVQHVGVDHRRDHSGAGGAAADRIEGALDHGGVARHGTRCVDSVRNGGPKQGGTSLRLRCDCGDGVRGGRSSRDAALRSHSFGKRRISPRNRLRAWSGGVGVP